MSIQFMKSAKSEVDRVDGVPLRPAIRSAGRTRDQRLNGAGRVMCVVLVTVFLAEHSPGIALCGEATAFTHATIETVSEAGTLKDATLLIEDGKIVAIGSDVNVPVTARVIDATGQTIIPAIIDPYHPVSVGSSSSSSSTRTVVINGRVVTIGDSTASTATPFQRIADNLDPRSLKRQMATDVRYGVGLMHVVTRGYGQSVHLVSTPENPDSAVTREDGTLFVAVTNATSSLDVLRNGLKGKRGQSSSRSGRSGGSGGERSGGAASGGGAASPTPRSGAASPDVSRELWEAVREGRKPLFVNVNNASAILYLLKIQDDYDKLQIVLIADAASVYQTLDALRGRKLSVILGAGLDVAPRSRDRINVPRMLAEAEIDFAFSPSLTGSLSSMSHAPLFPVSLLISSGLDRDAALKALTFTPAEMMGLGQSHGSIEVGKAASLAIFDGDPFDTLSQLRHVLVEGNSVYEN